ncbi:MAG: RNB domain-containing ribonuclease, partial [Anaerolineales bacterium]|nr:RNB domain-containing ribonuclease [Anaerolineales bacterium]
METEIIEFLDGDSLKIGLVLKRTASRVQITDQNGKQHSLNSRQIMLFHDKKISSGDFIEFSRSYLEAVKTLSDEIDTELLWESLEYKGSELNPGSAAEIYFGNTETISQSAILRAIASDIIHFKRKGNHVLIRDPEYVEEQAHVLKKKAERQGLNDKFITWSSDILNKKITSPSTCPQEFLPFLNSLEQALSNDEYLLESWLKDLIKYHSGPFRSRAETIVLILIGGDRLPENADPFILESGIALEFSDASLEEAGNLPAFTPDETIAGVESNLIFSVDDEGTEEIDDALSLTQIDNNYMVGIHIADAARFIPPDSLLDQEASSRHTTVYLPHRQIRMLPEILSCDLMSLRENKVRPVVSCNLLISPDLEILDWSFSRSFLTVNKNLSYNQADALFQPGDSAEILPGLNMGLRLLKDFTDRLLEERTDKGAIIINRPELKITNKEGEIKLSLLDSDSPSRLIVSELMV